MNAIETGSSTSKAAYEANARLFMVLFMASWSIGFITLFMAQLYLQLDAVVWPPPGAPEPPRVITGWATLVVVLSSAAYHWGLLGIEKNKTAQLTRGLAAASALSFVFLLLQMATGFQAVASGLLWNHSAYAALFWIFAGYHYAHALVGCIAGIWLTLRAQAHRYSVESHLTVRLWGYYWHSIGAIWILIYLLVFGLPS